MTTIYVANDPVNSSIDYICDSQATIDAGKAAGYIGTFSIGDVNTANAILTNNQNAFITSPLGLSHLSQVKSIEQNPDGTNNWVVCDITTEPTNTDVLYELFCDIQPGFQTAVGTAQGLQIYQSQQQDVIAWVRLASYQTWAKWPVISKQKGVASATTV